MIVKMKDVSQKMAEIVDYINSHASNDHDKAVLANQILCDMITYPPKEYGDDGSETVHFPGQPTLYSALIEGSAVCDGYALCFWAVMHELGIPCLYVTGCLESDPYVDHAWNEVCIDGKWKLVDVTNNDIDVVGQCRSAYLLKDLDDYNNYTQEFLMGEIGLKNTNLIKLTYRF